MFEEFIWRLLLELRRTTLCIRSKMSLLKSWLQKTNVLYTLRIYLDKVYVNKRLSACILFVLLLFLYFGPYWFFGRSSKNFRFSHACLDNYIKRTCSNNDCVGNSFVRIEGEVNNVNNKYAPFVGNGFFAVNVDGDGGNNRLYIRHDRITSVLLSYDPLIELSGRFADKEESKATILDTRTGTVTQIFSYSLNGECVFVASKVYAHRTRPNVFVQEFRVDNPTLSSLHFELSTKNSNENSPSYHRITIDDGRLKFRKYTSEVQKSGEVYSVIVGQQKLSADVTVNPNSQENVRIITLIDIVDENKDKQKDEERTKAILQVYDSVVSRESNLYQEHVAAWNEMWSKGFTISHSKAPNSLNVDLINATVYYLLSNSVSLGGHGDASTEVQRERLYSHEECFNFHNTLMYPSKLWLGLSTVQEVLDAAYSWKITLDKRGCSSLVQAGAEGILQAMMLSFGGFKFTKQHLEFDVDPSELHRDYTFRGIVYNSRAQADVWVQVGTDNKPLLYVSINNSDEAKKFYACDAGCLDDPVELRSERVSLPVKLTDPLTPILYITDDLKHIQELKHAIHVKEVVEAPPHEHHVIAMHKHGHRLGGLPTVFWVALIFLLVTFHLFLFKLIYNEYCRDYNKYNNFDTSSRMRYGNVAYNRC